MCGVPRIPSVLFSLFFIIADAPERSAPIARAHVPGPARRYVVNARKGRVIRAVAIGFDDHPINLYTVVYRATRPRKGGARATRGSRETPDRPGSGLAAVVFSYDLPVVGGAVAKARS